MFKLGCFFKVLSGCSYEMMGGSETVSGDKDGVHAAIHVPIGWQRKVEGRQVIYVRCVGSVKQVTQSYFCLLVFGQGSFIYSYNSCVNMCVSIFC